MATSPMPTPPEPDTDTVRLNAAHPAGRDAPPRDEFTAGLLAALHASEAASLLAHLQAGRREAYRAARAAWSPRERQSRRAMAVELGALASDALGSALQPHLRNPGAAAREITTRATAEAKARTPRITVAQDRAILSGTDTGRSPESTRGGLRGRSDTQPRPEGKTYEAAGTCMAFLRDPARPEPGRAPGAPQPARSLASSDEASRDHGIDMRTGREADQLTEWEAG